MSHDDLHLGELLDALPVTEHQPDFWDRLEAELDTETAVDLTDHRRRRWTLTAAAAAAAAAIIAVVAIAYTLLDDPDTTDVTTNTPPTTVLEVPVTTTPDPTLQSADDGQSSVGTAAETWATPEQRDSSPQVLPWHSGFVVVPVSQESLDQVWVSDDGSVWEQTELDDPFGPYPTDLDQSWIEGVVSDGEHLVVARGLSNSQRQQREGTEIVQIAATDDLSTWETWDFTPDLPQDLPSRMIPYFALQEVDVTDRGWAATASLSFSLDLTALSPSENGPVDSDVFETNGVWPDGTLFFADANGIRTDTNGFFAWDDLGIDYETYLEYSSADGVQSVTRAAWGEDLTVSPGPPWPVNDLQANAQGALASHGATLTWTDDWQTWDKVPGPPAVSTGGTEFARVPSGVILFGRWGVWIGGPDGSDWRPVELPRLEGRTIWPLDRDDQAERPEGLAIIADIADYGDGVPDWWGEHQLLPDRPPPEFVIIASPDGERWLLEDLDLGLGPESSDPETSSQGLGPEFSDHSATISGDRVLVRLGTDVTIHEIP